MACGAGSRHHLKLLLDEHLSPEIARQLRARGHDVLAVGEHPHLRGRPDRVHFASLPEQRRAIVTRDLADFRPLLSEALRQGQPSYGLVCVPRRFSLNRDGVGRLVRALEALLTSSPDPESVVARGGEIWLQDPDGR